jgi:hypothetical protein
MAIARPGTIDAAALGPATQWRTGSGGFLASRGMTARGQGKKVVEPRCGQAIEAKPALVRSSQREAVLAGTGTPQ